MCSIRCAFSIESAVARQREREGGHLATTRDDHDPDRRRAGEVGRGGVDTGLVGGTARQPDDDVGASDQRGAAATARHRRSHRRCRRGRHHRHRVQDPQPQPRRRAIVRLEGIRSPWQTDPGSDPMAGRRRRPRNTPPRLGDEGRWHGLQCTGAATAAPSTCSPRRHC